MNTRNDRMGLTVGKKSKSLSLLIWLVLLLLSGCNQAIAQPDAPSQETEDWQTSFGVELDSEKIYQENIHLFDYDQQLRIDIVTVGSWKEGIGNLYADMGAVVIVVDAPGSPPFWAISSIVTMVGAFTAYPAHFWMIRHRMLEWGVSPLSDDRQTTKPVTGKLKVWCVVLPSCIFLFVCFGLAFCWQN